MAVAVAASHLQFARAGLKSHFFQGRIEEAEDHMSAGEGGVAAKIDFGVGCKPAQIVCARACLHEEGGLSQIIFRRDRLHARPMKPGLKGYYCRRMAAKDAVAERIYLPKFELHQRPPCRKPSGKSRGKRRRPSHDGYAGAANCLGCIVA